jgi:imidazole glycerol-phosphate synthase subunit HisF
MPLGNRVIPVLQLKGRALVKTERFRRPVYLGDPLNAVRIFNDMGVDELGVIALTEGRSVPSLDWEFLADLASEAFMPMAFGGGVRSLADARRLCEVGFEKVIVGTGAWEIPDLISELSGALGNQSVVAAIDYSRSRWLHRTECRTRGGQKPVGLGPCAAAAALAQQGAGELLLTCVDRDGCNCGYDIELLRQVLGAVDVPVIVNGGARGMVDVRAAFAAGATGAAGGSMFVFAGGRASIAIGQPECSQ